MLQFDSRRAAVQKIREKLEDDESFRQKDRRNRWFCPYCGEIVGHIHLSDDPLVREHEAPSLIAHHLMQECAAFKEGAEPRAMHVEKTPLPLAELETPPAQETRVHHTRDVGLDEVVAFVRRRMHEDELFRQRDERNRWFCPFCGNVMYAILVPENLMEALQDVPFLVADHLANECALYAKDRHPGKRLSVSPSTRKKVRGTESMPTANDTRFIAGLDEARRRQRHMLPSRLPEVANVEFECFYQPCDLIGGDFYDFIEVGENRIGIVIGDVSGHGIEAAIVMAMVKKLIQVHGRNRLSAAETLIVTNADIADDVGEGVFISVFYCILNTDTGEMTCARAGHPPAFLYNRNRMSEPEKIAPRGLAIGLDGGERFARMLEEWVVEVEPGDLFIGYTDGLIELANRDGDELGVEGLANLVKRYGDRKPHEAVRQTISASQKFAGSQTADDDITVVAFRLKG